MKTNNNTQRGGTTNNNTQRGGTGFFGLLTILFIGLKLTNYIDWDWVWVLSPLWLPLAVILAIVVMIKTFFFLLGKVKKS